MGFIFKLWILLTVVYIGPSKGDDKIVKRSFTVTSEEEVESIMQELLQETCMSAPKADTSSTATTQAQSSSTKTSKQTSADTTPSTSTKRETTKGAVLDLTNTPQITDITIPSSTATVDITKETTTSIPTTTTSYVSTDEASTTRKETSVVPLSSVDFYCKIWCNTNLNSSRYDNSHTSSYWVGEKVGVGNEGFGNLFCGCTCTDKQCTGLRPDCQHIVVQRRVNASVGFNNNLEAYKEGFGNPTGNYWIGLEKLHELTKTFTGARLAIYFKKGGTGAPELESANNVKMDAGNYRLHFDDPGSGSYWYDARERTFRVEMGDGNDCGSHDSGWWGDDPNSGSKWCNPNSQYEDKSANRGVRMQHASSGGIRATFIEIRLYLSGKSEDSC